MTFDELFLNVAHTVAQKSKDTTKVGACLVDEDNAILMTAYNGPPKGVIDSEDRFQRPKKYLYASHAEQNLIAFCARSGIKTKGLSVFVTHAPCSSCAKTLIQAGIKKVVFADGKTSMDIEEFKVAEEMFNEANVYYTRHNS